MEWTNPCLMQGCGQTLWQDISDEQSRWAERVISLSNLPPRRKSPCATHEKRPNRMSFLNDVFQMLPLANDSSVRSTASQRYIPENNTEMTSVSRPRPVWNAESNVGNSGEYETSHEQPIEHSPAPPAQSFFWVLLGVNGATRTMFPAQIFVDEWTTDSRFFKELKRTYWEHRGWLRSWFSIWRLQYCEVVKVGS